MLFRRASKRHRSLRLLVKLIATEKDRHQLISKVASDVRLLKQAQRLYRDRQNKTIGKQDDLIELCRVYQIGPDLFDEQLRLIAYMLNLVELHEDYYRELGLEHGASQETIKHVYRKLCLAYHPDRISNNAENLEKFLRIRQAYEILSNQKLRRKYDRRSAMPAWTEESFHEKGENALFLKKRLYHALGLVLLVLLLLAFSIGIDYQDWQTIRNYGSEQEGGILHDRAVEYGSQDNWRTKNIPNDVLVGFIDGSGAAIWNDCAFLPSGEEAAALLQSSGSGADRNGIFLQHLDSSQGLLEPEDIIYAPVSPSPSAGAFGGHENGYPKEFWLARREPCFLARGGFYRPFSGIEDSLEAPVENETGDSKTLEVMGAPVGASELRTSEDTDKSEAGIPNSKDRHENDGKSSRKTFFDGSHVLRSNEEAVASPVNSKTPAPDGEKASRADRSGSIEPSEELTGRIQDFLNRYAHAYEQRNLSHFIELFEPGAMENGERIADLIPIYRQTFQEAEVIDYKLRLLTWYTSRNHIDVNANARLSMRLTGQPSWESGGFVHLRLVQRGNDFRVRSINYSFR